MEGKRGNDLQALTEIADNDVLIVDTGEGTRKITYGALCAAVKNTLGIREVVESTNITEPGFLMDGKTASEAFAELYSNSEYEAFDVTLTEGAEGVSVSAFRCNGVTSISFLLNAGAKSVIRFSVPVKFRPIYTVSGSFSCTSTDRDSGKCAGVTLSSSGIGFIWILTPLEGSCYASIVYPSSNNQS